MELKEYVYFADLCLRSRIDYEIYSEYMDFLSIYSSYSEMMEEAAETIFWDNNIIKQCLLSEGDYYNFLSRVDFP